MQRLTSADTFSDATYTPGSLCTSGTVDLDYSYTYDLMGNRTSASLSDGVTTTTTSYMYDEANRLIVSQTGLDPLRSYTYNANGNRIGTSSNSAQEVSYAYDAANRLTGLTTYAPDGVTPVDQFSYAYNGDGDRISQTVNSVTTQYLLDPMSGLTQVLGEFGNQSSTYYLLGLDVIGQQQGTDWAYFGYDGLGSVRQMYSGIGTVGYAANYDPYGNVYASDGFGGTLGFTGEQTDVSGLQYLRARYMDSATGTFLTKDPVQGVLGGASIRWNGYGYAGGNPVNYVDPDGRFFFIPALIALGAAVGTGFVAGALISGGIDIASQVKEFIDNGGDLRCFDLNEERLGMAMAQGGINGAIVGGLGHLAGAGAAALGFGKVIQGLAKFGAEVAWDVSQGASLQDAIAYNLLFEGLGRGVGKLAKWGAGAISKVWKASGGDALMRAGLQTMRGMMNQVSDALSNTRAGQWISNNMPNPFAGRMNAPDAIDELMRRDKIFDPLGQCNSFSADTLVATEDGGVPIADIEIGDEVLAYDEASGEVGAYTVTNTISHIDPEIVLLVIDGEYLETTREHPFYTDDGDWVDAENLTIGEEIRNLDGDYGVVESVEVITVSQAMYNLTVDTTHTFFVGEGEWLVHNQQMPLFPDMTLPGFELGELEVERYSRLYGANKRRGYTSKVTPHHMPSDAYMLTQNIPNYSHGRGITMNMSIGRHQLTRTFGGKAVTYGSTARNELARDIWNVRKIYQQQGLYGAEVREKLREVIMKNTKTYPQVFGQQTKPRKSNC